MTINTKTLHFTVVALASILLGSTISACNKVKTPPEPAEVRAAQEQQAPSAMPGAVDGDMEQLSAACQMVRVSLQPGPERNGNRHARDRPLSNS